MTQNPNEDIAIETLENQITLETLDHLIINAIKEICYSEKNAQMRTPCLSTLINKSLENPD